MSISEMRKALAKIAGVLAVLADMKLYANSEGTSFTIAKRATADYPLLVEDIGDSLVEAAVPAIDTFEAKQAEERKKAKEEAAKAKAAEIKGKVVDGSKVDPDSKAQREAMGLSATPKKPATNRRTRRTASK